MKNIKTFWTRVFGIKIGDIVRIKYGKVYWEVWNVVPSVFVGGQTIIKARRFVKHKWGVMGEIANATFFPNQVIEVYAKEDMVEPFPSVLLR